jgi:hypothetical protein
MKDKALYLLGQIVDDIDLKDRKVIDYCLALILTTHL